jgi:hypothetical protein
VARIGTGTLDDVWRTPRRCLAVAVPLAAIGLLRFGTDLLTDAAPGWWDRVDPSWLRYLGRAPSDGSVWSLLSVQWFKVVSIPCGVSVAFLLHRLFSHSPSDAQQAWSTLTRRRIYIGALLSCVTLMEIEKATHVMGLRMAGLLEGESAWLNHALHLASAVAGWYYMRWLRLSTPARDTTTRPRAPQP